MNQALGNVGRTVFYTEPVLAGAGSPGDAIAGLAKDMAGGRVSTLVILGGNPVFTAPADLRFAEAMEKVPLRLRLGLYEDETSRLCHWHVPEAHALEAWSDARAFDGTATILQPLILPLFDGKSCARVPGGLLRAAGADGLRHRPGPLARGEGRRRLRGGVAQGGARRRRRGHGFRASAGVVARARLLGPPLRRLRRR